MSPNGYKENETIQNYLRIVEVLMVNKRKMKKKKCFSGSLHSEINKVGAYGHR